MVIELCQSLCACGDELVEMGVLPERSYVSTIEVLQQESLPVSVVFSDISTMGYDAASIIITVLYSASSIDDDVQTDYRFNSVIPIAFDESRSQLTFRYDSLWTETTVLIEGIERRRRMQRRKLSGNTGAPNCYWNPELYGGIYECPSLYRG